MPAAGIFGLIRTPFAFRINVASGTSAEEYVTDLVFGYRCTLEKAYFVASGDGAGAGATRLFRVIKTSGTTDYVAASATIALASTQTKGAVTAFTLSTTPSDYEFFDADKLTLDVTGAGTQFTTLTGNWYLQFRTRAQAR